MYYFLVSFRFLCSTPITHWDLYTLTANIHTINLSISQGLKFIFKKNVETSFIKLAIKYYII